jgi:subtilisin family serine protease
LVTIGLHRNLVARAALPARGSTEEEGVMLNVRYGGKKGRLVRFAEAKDLLVVRTASRNALEDVPLSSTARRALADFERIVHFREAGVELYRARTPQRARRMRDVARGALKKERAVQFAGRALRDAKSGAMAVYTENLFIKLDDDVAASRARKLIKDHRLEIKQELDYARNGFFVGAKEGMGQKVFALAEKLLENPSVDLCQPELVRRLRPRTAFPQQWHLKKTTVSGNAIDAHANVAAAWALTQGEGTVIAVIDDGFDLEHEELASPNKIVAPRDATRQTDNPRPVGSDRHGHACAGVACADGRFGASGVAPRARLMPIRLASGLGSQREADAFFWAAQHGADVISCSWGPADGTWFDPNDPLHDEVVPIADSTRLAIDWAVANGRGGKGCVIVWAAGNGNESVDNDGYASYAKVTAVAACNDMGKKSAYSDFGAAVWCAFPSNNGDPSKTPGIWTTDRSGASGYNPGSTSRGDAAGNYTNSFGGTSSAAPGVAGVAALILARNPGLRWDEVKDVLKRSCDRIDPSGGKYDADGHSKLYGFGRVNAKRAVELSLPANPDRTAIRTEVRDVAIRDLQTSKLALKVADDDPLKSVRVAIDIDHTYIGDLVVTVRPPSALALGAITLHDRGGGGTANIKKTYDAVSAPGLAALAGKRPKGTWTLVVQDKERLDQGTLRKFSLEMVF